MSGSGFRATPRFVQIPCRQPPAGHPSAWSVCPCLIRMPPKFYFFGAGVYASGWTFVGWRVIPFGYYPLSCSPTAIQVREGKRPLAAAFRKTLFPILRMGRDRAAVKEKAVGEEYGSNGGPPGARAAMRNPARPARHSQAPPKKRPGAPERAWKEAFCCRGQNL